MVWIASVKLNFSHFYKGWPSENRNLDFVDVHSIMVIGKNL